MRTLSFPLRNIAITVAAATALGACGGYYNGYGGYGGYGGVSVGVGTRGYYDPYGGDWGYYSSRPYWGWYDNYYYPGAGIYIYDRDRRRHRWTGHHQRYWSDRQTYWRSQPAFRQSRRQLRENWGDFRRDRGGEVRQERRAPRRGSRSD